ncbi:MAG: ABC transporter ATP-binding protein [Hungatella sp.]|nr:ABC transporter ATP-binding protein [Hungatella sp.]
MEEKLLEIQGLRTTFFTREGEVHAVDGVEIEIGPGESVGIVGESGCGKSMTAMSVMGLLKKPGKVDGGRILFEGRCLTDMALKERRKILGNEIAMIFQEPMTSLNPVTTVGKQVQEALCLHNKELDRREARERVIQVFEMVGIPDAAKRYGEYPHQLSGGLRQRVMIAMAMVCNPKLLIADEPTTALDVTIEAQILHLMKQLQEEKKTAVMMITHNLGVVAQFCTRLYVMYAGKVMESGTVKEIFKHVCHPYTDGLMRSVPDMESKERLYNIRGMVPSMLHLPKGCRFCPRCQYSGPKCFEKEPELYQVSPGHFVRCFLFENSAEGGGTDEAQVKETMIQEREDG